MANVRVALRVRPLSKRENAEEARIIVNVDGKITRIRNIKLDYKPENCVDTRERLLEFGFDYCYWSVDPEDPKYASQEVVFQDLGTTVLSEAIKGYNVCLFAYGQTGSGKTYTMMGTPASIGLTPRICEGLFNYSDGSPGTPSSSRVEVSFLEIYNERVRDLLHQSEQKKPYTLRVREHPEKGPYVQGLSQHVVTDYEQVVALLEQGMENRITAATHVHDASSRSHAIFTIHYTQAMLEDNLPSEIASKINLVDLAGSERASPNYCKDRLTEGSNINRSLVTLGIVISALAQNSQMTSSSQSINSILSDGDSGIPGSPSGSSATGSKRQPFVPYRDSILTWLLKDSLGGNSKTIMVATISPASSSYNETISTLRYASNAKNIINKPRVNEDANVKLIRELREEINRLKAMLRNFEMRTISPAFSEDRDGNLTELVLQSELKIEQLTKDWSDKWTDKASLMEQYNVDIKEGKARVTIDSGLPHLIAMDDDILSTGVVIYYLREGTTIIGSGDHDIVLQGENIEQEHCIIENKSGVVELRPSLGAHCTANGQEVKDACRLSQGAVIVLGKSHRFRFNHPAEAAVLRQMRSDSQASFVSDCSLDWLDLSGDFSSSSKGNSLILNTSDAEPPSEEHQQGLRELDATYRKQIEKQQQYVEDLKSQIQTAQVKGEKELDQEQSLINQQIQEYQQWLIKEKERVNTLCQQKRESSSQTEPKTYVEVEVQNCVQTDIQPSLEEQEGKKLVQLELLRKCSLRRAERNIRRKRVKLQLERIVKKQKLLEAKRTLQQLQAACWLSNDLVKPTLLHVPKVQETSVSSTALHRSSSSPSGFSSYRRCSLPWTLQTLPDSYSAVLKRKCKSELADTTKAEDVRNPLRSISIDCLLNSFGHPGSNEELECNLLDIGTKNLQFGEEQRADFLIKQISAGAALFSSDPQMNKKRQKMDKPRGGSKGSSNSLTAEQPKKRNIRATVPVGTRDTKTKPLKSPSPLTVGPKKCTVQEKSKTSPKGDTGKLLLQKSVKQSQLSPSQAKPPSGESTLKSKPARNNMASLKPNPQRKPAEQTSKTPSSVDTISKMNNRRGGNQTSDRSRISTERLNRVLLKSNNPPLGDCKKDDHTDSSDSESFYSIDSLSSAYASALSEQLRQEELQRHKTHTGHKDSDSEDSQMSQDSLAEKDKRREKHNKRRCNKYKTIGATSTPTTSFHKDGNSFPLVTTGSVTTGLTKTFSLDSLADAEDVLEADSSEELPAEIFWKLQSPRNLIVNEDQNKENIAVAREDDGLDLSNSFYLKVNDVPDYCNVTFHATTENQSAALIDECNGKAQANSCPYNSTCSSSGLSSQTDTLKQDENTVHEDALSPVCAPILESQIREGEMNHLCTNDNIYETATKPFPSQLEAPHIKSVQYKCVPSVPHTETPDRSENTYTGKESDTVQGKNGHEYCPSDCNPLDEKCSSDVNSPCSSQNNSLNIQESSSDLTKNKRKKSYSESKDDIATSSETPLTCTITVPLREKIQGEDKQSNTKSLSRLVSSINNNEVVKKLCSKEPHEISLVREMERSEGNEIIKLPSNQESSHLNTTAKPISENINDVMSMSSHAQLENLTDKQLYTSPLCQESVMSEPLCCESIQKQSKEDNPLMDYDSDGVQVLSQSQRNTVERDINANKDMATEKPTNPVQEREIISEDNNDQLSIQKHDRSEHGETISTGYSNSMAAESTLDKNLSALENKTCSTLAQSLCHKSEKAASMPADPPPVTKPTDHLYSDDGIKVAAEYSSVTLHKNGEDVCFTIQDDGCLDENYHKADIAENSSGMQSIVVTHSSENPGTVMCGIRSKSEDFSKPDDSEHTKNYKDKACSSANERTLPLNNMASRTNGESQYTSAKTCFIGKPEGSPESQNTIETSYLLNSECVGKKSQRNNEVLPKDYSKELELSLETNQGASADDIMTTHNHLVTGLEVSKQVCTSSKMNTPPSNRVLSTYDNIQSHISMEENPKMPFKTYQSCLIGNIPLKRAKLRKFKDINSNDEVLCRNDFSSTMDFPLASDHYKFSRGPENSKTLENTVESSPSGTRPVRDASANRCVLQDMSGTCQPLPYYEAKMQNESFCKVNYRAENLNPAMFSDHRDNSAEMFTSKQPGLNIGLGLVKDTTIIDDVLEVKSRHCSTSHKCTEEERQGYNPQHGEQKHSSYRTRGCGSVIQSAGINTGFSMPNQYGGSQNDTDLNSITSNEGNVSNCSYLQSRSEDTGERLNSDICNGVRTPDNLVQQNAQKYEDGLTTNEGEFNKRRIRDTCLHDCSSAPSISAEEYTNLKSKDTYNLSSTIAFPPPQSDTLRGTTSDYVKETVRPRDQNEACMSKSNSADPEIVALFKDNRSSRCSMEEEKYQPIFSSSPHGISDDEVNGEHSEAMTSNCIENTKPCKVECEFKLLGYQNIPLLGHSNRVSDRATCAVEDNDSSVGAGDIASSGREEKCLMTTGICGVWSPDLSESTDMSSSDTDTSKYLILKNVPGLQNHQVDAIPEGKSYSPMSKDVEDMSQSAQFNEVMSPCTDNIDTPSPEYPNILEQMDSTESNMNEISSELPAISITPSPGRSNFHGKFRTEHVNSKIKPNVEDHFTQTVQSPYPVTVNSIVMEGVGKKTYLLSKPPDEHPNNLIPKPSSQAEKPADIIDNTEGLHFSSSDINPFVHSWQQDDSLKPGWRNCTFNSASDVSSAKFREQADKLIRCSSVDEGLNSHNSPFHSHLSSYANAKMVSSTTSSLGRNDSRPDVTSLDDSQELLSDESAILSTGNRAEFTGMSGLQTKLEDYSQLDEIIFLYTSESESYIEPVKRVSGEQGTHVKHKHRKTSKHQRNHTDISSSRQIRNRNVCQRPASWSSVQSMSLHLSQLLQETSELLGNLSKHNPENLSKDTIKMQRDFEEQILKRSVRDSSTQTSVDRGIQTDAHMANNAHNHTGEHSHFLNSSGINVIVKVLGTESLTHIPQNTGLTEQNSSKVAKTRTQSLPNLYEYEPRKPLERVLSPSPQVRASTPFLTGFQDMSSTTFSYSSSKSSSISTKENKCAEDTVVNSPSSSVVDATGYRTSYHERNAMVDRASSPILTVKASKKFHHKLIPDNHLNNQNFAKILRSRKRKERELRDLQLNSSQTETDSESTAGNECEATRSSSLRENTKKRVSTAKFQRFVSEGCILRDTRSSFTNQSSSNSEVTGKRYGEDYFISTHREKAPHPWEHLQSLQNLSLMSQPLTGRDGQIPKQSLKDFGSDKNDLGSFTFTSNNTNIKNKSHPYSPSQMSALGLHLQEDGLSIVESECNTDLLLGQEPAFRSSDKPRSYALQDLPMHNKFSNWSGVQCSAARNGMVSSSPNLNVSASPTKTEASQEVLDSRSQEIERLQRERAEVLSAIHLEMNPLPLTVQLAEAKLSYGIGETDALLRVLQTGKMDPQDTVSIKKQLYERHLKVIENLRKEREDRLQIFRRSRSLSPQKQLSASQTSLTSLRECDLPSRRREYLQQLRRDVVDNTRIQEPKTRAAQCPSEIEVMLKDYQKAREEAKTEIAKARDKLRERAEMERRRLQQGSLTKDDTKMKTLVSTSTLFTNSSLSLSSGPTSGYNSGMTATIGQLSSHETLPRSLDPAVGSGRGRSAVRNCDLFTPINTSVPDPESYSSTVEAQPGKSVPSSPQHSSLLQPTVASYQELATQVQASAMAEIMTACSYDLKKLYNGQAAAGWIYQSTEKDVLVYYKAFSSPTKHGFIGAGVIKRPLHDVWCMVKDISTRRLYDQSILTACVHERVSSNIQLVHVMTDTSLCYLKQPRDFCCIAVEFKQEKCYSLCFQSVYNESMPRPNKDTVRGELLPSAWVLQPDTINGEAVTRVIYMIQVDLGAPVIPTRLLNVISKRQPLVIANLAGFLAK
ncbi:stAR-related lipid transfer protein 9 [Leptodactylus fuscus]|uniref:stAR-related lipid transfer protein 9 n=1 Tax=Leptodactylus fuscus TaxID=238119 RepID=UPI003F4E64B8